MSGGMSCDMTIHDYDLIRFLLGEEMDTVSAIGSCLVDEGIESVGDVDTLMVNITSTCGKQCNINNSRVCSYNVQGKSPRTATRIIGVSVMISIATGFQVKPN